MALEFQRYIPEMSLVGRERILKTLGPKIMKLRQAINLKQKSLAYSLGIAASFMCNIEAGRRLPRFELVIAIAKELGVRITDLLTPSQLREFRWKLGIPVDQGELTILLERIFRWRNIIDVSSYDFIAFVNVTVVDDFGPVNDGEKFYMVHVNFMDGRILFFKHKGDEDPYKTVKLGLSITEVSTGNNYFRKDQQRESRIQNLNPDQGKWVTRLCEHHARRQETHRRICGR